MRGLGNIHNIAFGMMPWADTRILYKNDIILYDNIGRPLRETMNDEVNAFIGADMPKRIDFTVIVLCIRGGIEVECNLRIHTVKAGSALVLVPGTIADNVILEPESEFAVLAVQNKDLAPDFSFYGGLFSAKNFSSTVQLDLQEDTVVMAVESYLLLRKTLEKFGDATPEVLVKAHIMVLSSIAAVDAEVSLRKKEKVSQREMILNEFLNQVERRHREHRDVAWYAQKTGLSPKYLAKVIMAESGKRPTDWIRDYVILDAKSLIKSGRQTIGELCRTMNFNTQAQFNKYFKDATGMTPLEYRKS